MKVRIIKEKLYNSLVNGTGIRMVIFFAGCSRNCRGCHNKEFQDFNAGEECEVDDIVKEVLENKPMIDGVTLSGGDPMFQYEGLLELCKKLKEHDINIWVYTGALIEDIMDHHRELTDYVNVFVDGEYKEELNVPGLKYKGSSNQRIIEICD